jgi:cell division protein FtsB
MSRWGRPATMALVALGFVAILFLFVFPTRSYLSQRRDISSAQHDVTVLRQQNEKLAQQARRLQSPSEIERLAREQFHYVHPGEKAYTIIPAPAPSTSGASSSTTTAP